ncbi:hypothetical protein VTO42DRAFT_7780 [Malbranchea cinnamomea]
MPGDDHKSTPILVHAQQWFGVIMMVSAFSSTPPYTRQVRAKTLTTALARAGHAQCGLAALLPRMFSNWWQAQALAGDQEKGTKPH